MCERSEPDPATLLDQLEALGRDLAVTRSELSRLSLEGLATDEIPFATAELFEIVAQTEGAAERIMDGCETLDRVGELLAAGEPPAQLDAAQAVFAATRRIYAACGFQDLTGQRVTKVVDSLVAIEAGIAALTTALGGRPRPPAVRRLAARHGPHPSSVAMTQTDVDHVLREVRV